MEHHGLYVSSPFGRRKTGNNRALTDIKIPEGSGALLIAGVGGVPHFYPHFLGGRGVGFFHTNPLFWGVGGWGKPPNDTPPPNRPLPV